MIRILGSNLSALIFLLLVNLIPLYGVLFWGWQVFSLLIIYWLENLVVGWFNLLKLRQVEQHQPPAAHLAGGFLSGFFLLHYGLFCLVHGIFLLVFFFSSRIDLVGILISFASITLSHFISYQTNFVAGQEYQRLSSSQLFAAPYKRVVVMQLTIILGSFWALGSQNPVPALVIMVLLKMATDLGSHLYEHKAILKNSV